MDMGDLFPDKCSILGKNSLNLRDFRVGHVGTVDLCC